MRHPSTIVRLALSLASASLFCLSAAGCSPRPTTTIRYRDEIPMRQPSINIRLALAGVILLCLYVVGCSPGPTTWKVDGGTAWSGSPTD